MNINFILESWSDHEVPPALHILYVSLYLGLGTETAPVPMEPVYTEPNQNADFGASFRSHAGAICWNMSFVSPKRT